MALAKYHEENGRCDAIVYSTGAPPLDGDVVQFRLLYSGDQLLSDGGPKIKHAIRMALHPQLKQLWNSNPQLLDLAVSEGAALMHRMKQVESLPIDMNLVKDPSLDAARQECRDFFWRHGGQLYARGPFNFVPLVAEPYCLRVTIDILFLRPDQHPLIKKGGDIDNRMKTLFDALRVPDTTNGLGLQPGPDEDPIFVLLQDDSLISEIRVVTDNLLMLPAHRALNAKDVFLVIDVKLNTAGTNVYTYHFR